MAQHAPERPNVARVVTQTCGAQEHPLHTLQTCQATLGTLQLVVHRGVFASPLSIAPTRTAMHCQWQCLQGKTGPRDTQRLCCSPPLRWFAFLATITAGALFQSPAA